MDFLRTTNDWDLEAIIRGWGGGGSGGCSVVQLPPPSPDPFLGFEGFEFNESELATRGVVNELEEMCKPFVVQVEQAKNESPRSSQTETASASPCSSPFALFDHEDELEKPKEMEMEMKDLVDLDVEDHAQARSSCKKRKNKHKIVRVVHRGVGEDGVLMDKWNWRKYGQKSIKGSPYPRSYYRCSSSGGCHARKHVEQSKDDRHTFIVTYIADHSHLPPTRRHAQAGRKITKFSSSSSSATNVVNSHNKTPPEHMTWTISNPSIDVEDGDRVLLGGGSANAGVAESTGLQVMEELFSAYNSFDHDFNNWEFDPIFTT